VPIRIAENDGHRATTPGDIEKFLAQSVAHEDRISEIFVQRRCSHATISATTTASLRREASTVKSAHSYAGSRSW